MSSVLRGAAVGDVEAVKKWLNAGGHKREKLETVLCEAARWGHDNICQLLLDSTSVDSEISTNALQVACRYNQLSTTQLFVKRINFTNKNLLDALHDACVFDCTNVVQWLARDALQLSPAECIRWLFMTACGHGDMEVIKQLAAQMDGDVTDVTSQALRIACFNGKFDVVKWLTSRTTADTSSRGVVRTKNGEVTSLMAAAMWGKCQLSIARLLSHDISPHTVNMMSGRLRDTALHFVIWFETAANLQQYMACWDGNIEAVQALVLECNVDRQDNEGFTPLHIACQQGHVEVVRILMSWFANTNITDNYQYTAATRAENFGNNDVMCYLQYQVPSADNTNTSTTDNTDIPNPSLAANDDTTRDNSVGGVTSIIHDNNSEVQP